MRLPDTSKGEQALGNSKNSLVDVDGISNFNFQQ
jgi:hypothetical protein